MLDPTMVCTGFAHKPQTKLETKKQPRSVSNSCNSEKRIAEINGVQNLSKMPHFNFWIFAEFLTRFREFVSFFKFAHHESCLQNHKAVLSRNLYHFMMVVLES